MRYLRFAVVAALTFNAGQVFANQGDTLTVGGVEPSGSYTANLIDKASGVTYGFFMEARQNDPQTKGDTTIALRGPGITACSIRGPAAELVNNGEPFNFGGNQPFQQGGCGTAFEETVKISGCTALVQTHGFSHSDDPNVNYWGSVTIDVRYTRKPGNPASDRVEVNIYTPKEAIKLAGKVMGGTIAMPGCVGRTDRDDGDH
jgi:hypothetical protein